MINPVQYKYSDENASFSFSVASDCVDNMECRVQGYNGKLDSSLVTKGGFYVRTCVVYITSESNIKIWVMAIPKTPGCNVYYSKKAQLNIIGII